MKASYRWLKALLPGLDLAPQELADRLSGAGIAVDGITEYGVSTKDPVKEKAWKKAQKDAQPISVSEQRNKALPKRLDEHPELKDFYNEHDEFTVTNKDRNKFNETMAGLEDWEKALLKEGKHLYLVDFSNKGGLVMPLIV